MKKDNKPVKMLGTGIRVHPDQWERLGVLADKMRSSRCSLIALAIDMALPILEEKFKELGTGK